MIKKDWFRLVISIILCQLAGFIGSLFTTPKIPTWYAELAKPSFNPPNWIFSPVWITLFFLMGLTLFLLWRDTSHKDKTRPALVLFFIQLCLNMLWSILFFGLEAPFLAFIGIIVLWIFILATIFASLRVNRAAGILLLPYILWVSFAAVLNYFLWTLNA